MNLSKFVIRGVATCVLLANPVLAFVSIDSVYIGDLGNANNPNSGYGGVEYGYSIGKYEVTLNQYTEFLNAVAQTDAYGLYNVSMGTDLNVAGISRSGVSGGYSYSVIGSGNRPVTYVSWFDSARFVNWMHNGQPVGAQAAGTTEMGAYTLNGATSGYGFARNAGWSFAVPSAHEWEKAAYFHPAAQGGDADDYWAYPTRSNTQPNSRNGSDSDPNSGNFLYDDAMANGFNGGYAVTDSSIYSADQNYLTDVGSFSLASSYYGTFDQAGNVWEWTDLRFHQSLGVVRGGAWNSEVAPPSGGTLKAPPLYYEGADNGFRVVLVPEPSVMGFLALGGIMCLTRKRG